MHERFLRGVRYDKDELRPPRLSNNKGLPTVGQLRSGFSSAVRASHSAICSFSLAICGMEVEGVS